MPRPIILSDFCCSPRASVLFGSIRQLRRNAGCRFDWFWWMTFSATIRERWIIWVLKKSNVTHFIFHFYRFYSLARRNIMHRLLATGPKSSDFFWELDSACFSSHSARALWMKILLQKQAMAENSPSRPSEQLWIWFQIAKSIMEHRVSILKHVSWVSASLERRVICDSWIWSSLAVDDALPWARVRTYVSKCTLRVWQIKRPVNDLIHVTNVSSMRLEWFWCAYSDGMRFWLMTTYMLGLIYKLPAMSHTHKVFSTNPGSLGTPTTSFCKSSRVLWASWLQSQFPNQQPSSGVYENLSVNFHTYNLTYILLWLFGDLMKDAPLRVSMDPCLESLVLPSHFLTFEASRFPKIQGAGRLGRRHGCSWRFMTSPRHGIDLAPSTACCLCTCWCRATFPHNTIRKNETTPKTRSATSSYICYDYLNFQNLFDLGWKFTLPISPNPPRSGNKPVCNTCRNVRYTGWIQEHTSSSIFSETMAFGYLYQVYSSLQTLDFWYLQSIKQHTHKHHIYIIIDII